MFRCPPGLLAKLGLAQKTALTEFTEVEVDAPAPAYDPTDQEDAGGYSQKLFCRQGQAGFRKKLLLAIKESAELQVVRLLGFCRPRTSHPTWVPIPISRITDYFFAQIFTRSLI